MKICLDLRTAVGPMHGIARYGIELVRALQELDQVHQILILAGSQRLPDLGRHRSTRVIRCSVSPYSLLEQFWVPRLMARLQPDLYHCLTYGCPAFLRPPFLFTVHDLLPLTRRQEFGWSRRFYFQTLVRAAARRSSGILVVSQYTLACLSQWLPRASWKIRVVPSGGDHMRKIDVTEEDRSRFLRINPEERPFFLSVSNPRPHKNILFAVECFNRMVQARAEDVLYILVGRQHSDVHSHLARCPGKNQVRLAGLVSDGLLRLLYERAVALLFPSLGEGFGLPVVEAMQFGLPVLAFQDGAVPEILGKTGFVLSSRKASDWEHAMWDICQKRTRGGWDPERVMERAREFTWRRAAAGTLAVYEELLRQAGAPPAFQETRRKTVC